MCQKADSGKSSKRKVKYIQPRAGLALHLGTQTNTNSSEAQFAGDNTLDSYAEHIEYTAVMDQDPILQADEWPILDIPHREIISVPAKELFPADTCMSATNKCTGPSGTSITSAPLQTRSTCTIKTQAKW